MSGDPEKNILNFSQRLDMLDIDDDEFDDDDFEDYDEEDYDE